MGFGTWIGPTLFYAAQLVEEAFGVEADPVAFARVQTNLALNMNNPWAHNVHLNPHAIGMGSTTDLEATQVAMSSAAAGNSCSGLGSVACGEASVHWKVNAYSLPALLRHWNVPSSEELFIKVDVESYECQLIPSWLPWIESIQGSKPAFHIAFHGQIEKCSEEEFKAIYRFGKQFHFVRTECMDDINLIWKCESGEFMFF